MMKQAVIVGAKRTPIARKNGQLRHLQAQELAAPILAHLSKGIEERINDVILGNVVGPGGNIARLSVLEAGLPFSVPGVTLTVSAVPASRRSEWLVFSFVLMPVPAI